MSFAKTPSSDQEKPRRKGSLVVVVAALVLGLFAFPATAMAKDDEPSKVTVCKEHHGEYQIKLVKPDKVQKHLDNNAEDGVVGSSVPGMDGYNFGPDCVPACAPAAVTLVSSTRVGRKQSLSIATLDGTTIASSYPGYYGYYDYYDQPLLQTVVPAELLPGDFIIGRTRPDGQFIQRYSRQIHVECGANVWTDVYRNY